MNTTTVNTPEWLDKGDNAWQLTAATLVGLQSIPGLMILYGGIVKRKWAINRYAASPYNHRNEELTQSAA